MELNTLSEKIRAAVDELTPDLIRCLQELVRIPSVVGNEARAQDYMNSLYQGMGLEVRTVLPDIEALRGHPAFIDTGASYVGRPNLVATLPGDPDKPSLILNGHIDVVSPEPVEAWSRDPWCGEVEGERLYGRGAGDMKAGLLANHYALAALIKAGLRPAGTVRLMSVIDEEAGGAGGTLACLADGHTADAMICSEPHGMNVTVAHAGICMFRVRVVGRTAHGGLAHQGVNAFGKLIPLYQALEALGEHRLATVRYPLFERGSGRACHLSVGTVRAGDWPSTVAGEAVMECRISFPPGETMEQIRELVRRSINQAAQQDPWLAEHPPSVEWFGWQAEPWQQDPEHPFVRTMRRAAREISGQEAPIIGRASGIDSRFAPYFGMAAACTGPVASNIHGIDEYVELPSVAATCKVLALTMAEWCGVRD
ncbi:MAG: ArgE/DapE family deacylase [Desulfarculaceae bacterium]|nr:ArgE/DapE family deacylase [Desulfarculaceae bacterium]MCF8074503.1 ArgE/DapE family deacylase [Desulfarculaceae bacterium]MCF8103602.1 ArgE/DapE family deacylase [Desulfarculaceae bacterium]MCF8116893.1 ArgE/DapE family deacylase [Desulfarculaceae bacterium]